MEALTDAATNVDEREVDGETVIDFDINANKDYRIQSSVIVDDNNDVIEAAVRFGRIEKKPEIGVGKPILYSAWSAMVRDTLGDVGAVEADLSDFQELVPHLRVDRERIEEYDRETVTLDEFVAGVVRLSTLVERVFRGDTDNKIDEWL